MSNYKETIYSELDIHDCKILNIAHDNKGIITSIQIDHQLLKLPRWFDVSKKGNLYSRYRDKKSEPVAYAFIIKNWREKEGLKQL